MAEKTIRVVVVGSCLLYREGVRASLDRTPAIAVAVIAASSPDALQQAARLDPDVVVVEGRLPGRDEVETVRLVREAIPGAAQVVLVGDDTRRVRELWDLGVRGLVPASTSPDHLVAAVRAAAGGRRVVVDGVLWRQARARRGRRTLARAGE